MPVRVTAKGTRIALENSDVVRGIAVGIYEVAGRGAMSSIHIREETLEQIKRMLRGRVADLRLMVHQDQVVLLGTAINYHGKQLAQHYVLKVLGVGSLVNEIEVRQTIPRSTTDFSSPTNRDGEMS